MPAAAPEIHRAATFSACGGHRLLLERRWGAGPVAGFVMLNPSTADAERDDPTIRRCIGFARSWGFGGVLVANLFTFRATDPRDLARAPAAERNDGEAEAALGELAARADLLVLAWGAHHLTRERGPAVQRTLLRAGVPVAVLGRTKGGAPRHPLYLSARSVPIDAVTGRPVRTPAQSSGWAGC